MPPVSAAAGWPVCAELAALESCPPETRGTVGRLGLETLGPETLGVVRLGRETEGAVTEPGEIPEPDIEGAETAGPDTDGALRLGEDTDGALTPDPDSEGLTPGNALPAGAACCWVCGSAAGCSPGSPVSETNKTIPNATTRSAQNSSARIRYIERSLDSRSGRCRAGCGCAATGGAAGTGAAAAADGGAAAAGA